MNINKQPTSNKIAITPMFNETKAGIELPNSLRKTQWGKVQAVGHKVEDVEIGDTVFYEGMPLSMDGKEGKDLTYIIEEPQVAAKY